MTLSDFVALKAKGVLNEAATSTTSEGYVAALAALNAKYAAGALVLAA
jgi:hypothetical protein